MEKYKLGEMELKLAELIWDSAPLSTRDLVEACENAFSWKRTTTYTMLKRLCDRGIFQNDNSQIITLIDKEEYAALQGEQFINTAFNGSLPNFIAAFTKVKQLSSKEIREIQKLIDSHKED